MKDDRARAVWAARCLLRGAVAGTLATSDAGQPFASLVTPAPAPDLSVLLLLSGLSPHTRHLRAEPRCSLMVVGPPDGPNPQTAPRLSVTAVAADEPDASLKARWVARHPYAAFYADLADFRLVRLRPTGGQYVGGFGSAHRLAAADLQVDPASCAAVAGAEAALLAEAMASADGWRLAAVDVDGADLRHGEQVRRVAFPGPAADAAAARAALRALWAVESSVAGSASAGAGPPG